MKNTLKLATLILGVVLISCGGKSITPTPRTAQSTVVSGCTAPPASPTPTARPTATPTVKPTPIPGTWINGVTTDDSTVNTPQQLDALSSLHKHVMVRTVFDMPSGGGPVATDYLPSIKSMSQVSDVMGLINDSSTMSSTSLSTIQARITEYLGALGPYVKVWEVGNEINGNWLGSNVIAKVEATYDAVKSAGKSTSLTLYYENPATPGYDMIPWVDTNIPAGNRMRTGLDYVFVSYYEDQNGGHQLTQTELNTMFSALAIRFPNAKLGIGECGWGSTVPSNAATRAALLQRCYGYRVPSVPQYVGGNFYWQFRETGIPKTQPDWGVINNLIQ